MRTTSVIHAHTEGFTHARRRNGQDRKTGLSLFGVRDAYLGSPIHQTRRNLNKQEIFRCNCMRGVCRLLRILLVCICIGIYVYTYMIPHRTLNTKCLFIDLISHVLTYIHTSKKCKKRSIPSRSFFHFVENDLRA